MIYYLYLFAYKTNTCAIFVLQRSLTWREYVCDSTHYLSTSYNNILSLIPETIPEHLRQNDKDFIRDRCLTFRQIVVFILSAASSDKNNGISIKIGDFIKHARRSGLFPQAKFFSSSAVTQARAKVPWQAFESIFYDAVDLANSLWDEKPWHRWHSMRVYAIDGSKYTLPASDEIRKEFDPHSGFGIAGKGHYPQCRVSTVYDVFKRLPIGRCVDSCSSSEREHARLLLPHIPDNGVILFDRGYPGFEFMMTLRSQYQGHFVIRCPAQSTFPAVARFIRSKQKQALINIEPSYDYLHQCSLEEKALARPVRLRAIRLESPDGTVSALLTSMTEIRQFPMVDIINLYFERYRIEEHYRDDKITIEIEKFHSRTPNGIRQELFASAIMSVIARLLISLTGQSAENGRVEPQFKNAVLALAHEAIILTPAEPQDALLIFKELLGQIARVKYYKPKKKRPSQPRICKKPSNKWCEYRLAKMEQAN